MQSSGNSSAPASNARLSVLVAALVCGLAGYGLGRWQGGMATAMVAEQFSTAQAQIKTGQDALAAVEARTKRLEARQRINVAIAAFKNGDTQTGMSHLMEAEKALSYNGNEVSKPIAERLHALLQNGDVSRKIKDLEDIGVALDKDLVLTRASSG